MTRTYTPAGHAHAATPGPSQATLRRCQDEGTKPPAPWREGERLCAVEWVAPEVEVEVV